jgi:hypothetical protein
MHPDEGCRPIISQSAPIASGPEHFQAKWNTWRLGKCDHTNSSQVEHLATRKMRPHKDLFWRQPHGAHHRAPFCHIRFHHRAHACGVIVPHPGISGSAGITRTIGNSKRTQLADGIRHIVNQQINAPGDDFRAGCGDPGAWCGRAVSECLRVLAAPFGQANCPTLDQSLPTTSHRIQATLFRAGLEEAD